MEHLVAKRMVNICKHVQVCIHNLPEDPAFSTGGAHFFKCLFRLDKAFSNSKQIMRLIEKRIRIQNLFSKSATEFYRLF